jgi:hypothetical protein
MTVTVTDATEPSFIAAWPTGQTRATTSVLNTDVGHDTPNLVLVPVGDDGQVTLYNDQGRADLVADVVGWIPANTPLA